MKKYGDAVTFVISRTEQYNALVVDSRPDGNEESLTLIYLNPEEAVKFMTHGTPAKVFSVLPMNGERGRGWIDGPLVVAEVDECPSPDPVLPSAADLDAHAEQMGESVTEG